MTKIIEFFRTMSTSEIINLSFVVFACICLLMIVILSNKDEDRFNEWLLVNAIKNEHGDYLYRHDPTNRLYGREQLRQFYNQDFKQQP